MAQVEEQIINAGAQLIWVLEATRRGQPATGEACRTEFGTFGSDNGLCVGDAETMPMAGVFDRSPFAPNRGFDIIVRRSDMKIVWASSHGTGSTNENLTGAQVLDIVRGFTGR